VRDECEGVKVNNTRNTISLQGKTSAKHGLESKCMAEPPPTTTTTTTHTHFVHPNLWKIEVSVNYDEHLAKKRKVNRDMECIWWTKCEHLAHPAATEGLVSILHDHCGPQSAIFNPKRRFKLSVKPAISRVSVLLTQQVSVTWLEEWHRYGIEGGL
jgi:hypothetical protein